MDVHIYCLSDPETTEIRYVGKSTNPRGRLKKHLLRRENTHKFAWVMSLKKRGLVPVLDILETIANSDDTDWQESERWWIVYLRFIGCRLTNLNEGGKGGIRPSRETLAKLSSSHLGNAVSASTRAAISAANKGVPKGPRFAEKQRTRMIGWSPSDATREKMKVNGRVGMTPDRINQLRAASKTPEAIARMAAGLRMANKRPEVRERHRKRIEKLSKPVEQVCPTTGVVLGVFPSAAKAGATIRIHSSQIGNCACGRKGFRTAGGFAWRYVGPRVPYAARA